eukprot:1814290-Pleurochrysis_carterae.AAC.1
MCIRDSACADLYALRRLVLPTRGALRACARRLPPTSLCSIARPLGVRPHALPRTLADAGARETLVVVDSA